MSEGRSYTMEETLLSCTGKERSISRLKSLSLWRGEEKKEEEERNT